MRGEGAGVDRQSRSGSAEWGGGCGRCDGGSVRRRLRRSRGDWDLRGAGPGALRRAGARQSETRSSDHLRPAHAPTGPRRGGKRAHAHTLARTAPARRRPVPARHASRPTLGAPAFAKESPRRRGNLSRFSRFSFRIHHRDPATHHQSCAFFLSLHLGEEYVQYCSRNMLPDCRPRHHRQASASPSLLAPPSTSSPSPTPSPLLPPPSSLPAPKIALPSSAPMPCPDTVQYPTAIKRRANPRPVHVRVRPPPSALPSCAL